MCSCTICNRQHKQLSMQVSVFAILYAWQFSISRLQTRILSRQLQICINLSAIGTEDNGGLSNHRRTYCEQSEDRQSRTGMYNSYFSYTNFMSYQTHRFAVRGSYCLGSITKRFLKQDVGILVFEVRLLSLIKVSRFYSVTRKEITIITYSVDIQTVDY